MRDSRRRRRTAGYLSIVLAAVLWASLGPVARLALRDGVEPLELGFWRAAIAGLLFAAHALARGRCRIARADAPGIAAFAVVGVALFYYAYFQAVRTGGAALAAVLLYTAPAWVAIAAALWLDERMTRRKVGALILTLVGVALVAVGGAGVTRITVDAILWGLLAGIAYAGYYIFGKRYFNRYPAATVFMYAMPLGALLLAPAVSFAPKSGTGWLVIGFVAVLPTYAAYLLYAHGLRRVEATRAATVATLEPVVAAGLAFIAWAEVLGRFGYTGAAFVVAGVLATTTERPAKRNGDRGRPRRSRRRG